MSSRKRDALGRFSVGNDSFARESMSFKRPRGVNPSMPSYPGAVGGFNPAGQAPPQAGTLAAGYSSGVIDIASNSTSSLPVQARPWGPECRVGEYSPGALLFVRKDQNLTSFKSVADLPTANWLLREARLQTTFVSSSLSLDSNMGACSNDNAETGWLGDTGWNFFGPLRNAQKSGPASLITLCNVDVFGRTKVGNLWGSHLTTGMRVGLALVPMNIQRYGNTIHGPGTRSRVMDTYLSALMDDEAATKKNEGTPEEKQKRRATATKTARELLLLPGKAYDTDTEYTFEKKRVFTVWQWLPTLNGALCEHVKSYVGGTEDKPVDFIDHISLGVVSNCLQAGRTTTTACLRALQDTDAYTLLPQIEILIE